MRTRPDARAGAGNRPTLARRAVGGIDYLDRTHDADRGGHLDFGGDRMDRQPRDDHRTNWLRRWHEGFQRTPECHAAHGWNSREPDEGRSRLVFGDESRR